MVALIAQSINSVCYYHEIYIIDYIYAVKFHMVVPVAVLIINAIVVREVCRRATSDAVTSLGIQHHQSTSSNSAVPSVMLVTTSLVYVLLKDTSFFIYAAFHYLDIHVSAELYLVGLHLNRSVHAYNFYVYLITGKQFRSELQKLFRSSSSSSAAANDDVRVARRGQADTAV